MTIRSSERLQALLNSQIVVDLSDIRLALGDASRATTFRYLKKVPYRRSYNHNGRYYTRHDPTKYDRFGLFSHKGVHFSCDGSLTSTVIRLVQESTAGKTQRELRELLRVRVQVLLLETVRRGRLDRELVDKVFVYLHHEDSVRHAQLTRRREQIAVQKVETEITDAIVIEVLLALIRYPGSQLVEVVRRLQGHSPPIRAEHVRVVFDRFDLEHLGEKGGPSLR